VNFGSPKANIIVALLLAAFKVSLVGAVFMQSRRRKKIDLPRPDFHPAFSCSLFFGLPILPGTTLSSANVAQSLSYRLRNFFNAPRVGVGGWCIWVNLVEGAPVYLAGAVASFACALALVVYASGFIGK